MTLLKSFLPAVILAVRAFPAGVLGNAAAVSYTHLDVYKRQVMAVNLGITNLNMLADMALFKRMLKIPTQNNKLGVAEKSRVRKVLMEDYGLSEAFFKEIDSSVKKNCKNQNDIKTYFFMFQGFCNDLFNLLGNLMQWKFRFSMLVKKLLLSLIHI